jgi:pimeloyl-ACP methyl ester carboxylesterase
VVRDLLIRGMVAGFVAGLVCFGVAKVFGEPQVDRAISFEEAHAKPETAADHHDMPGMSEGNQDSGEVELVSRKVQSTWGLLTAVLVYGASMGGLFALAFAFLYGRVGDVSPRLLALLLALAALVAIYYVPSLKYPANPPAVGEPATIGMRTGLYLLMMLISLAGMVLAVGTALRSSARYGGLNASLIGAALYIGIVIIAQVILPGINEVPADFPATVLWKFRMASLGMQAITWATIGLVFGLLAEQLIKAPVTRATLANGAPKAL